MFENQKEGGPVKCTGQVLMGMFYEIQRKL